MQTGVGNKGTRFMAAGVVLVAALTLAACGGTTEGNATTTTTMAAKAPTSSTAPAPTTTTVSTAALAQQVLSILTNGNAKIQTDKNGQNPWPAVSADFSNTAQQLQAISYPANAQADAKTEVAILEKLSADAQQAETVGEAAASQNILNDESQEKADSDALRNDLGLPPAS